MGGHRSGRGPAVDRIGWGLACVAAAVLAAGACGGGDGAGGDGAGADRAPGEAGTAAGGETVEEGPDLREVNRFLSYSAEDSLVDLKLWAGYGGANSAWNYDGYYDGNATVVVPLDWRVEVTYQTLDANVPHSAGIVEPVDPMPADGSGVQLAFSGASTPSFVTGLTSTHEPVTFAFRADEAGRYWILCGVPGHARGGMWIWFEVSAGATAPDVREEDG